MSTFALVKFDAVKGKIKFFKLTVDGYCQFEQFWQEITRNGNLGKELTTIIARMNQVANLQLLPREKFNELTPKGETVKEFEIKTRNLRVYLIKDEHGHLIILRGKKNMQRKDINEFRSIKKRYIESKKVN